ncbi:MAG TPA: serine/threonine-protein kinase, partial [Enhygromyxa sp.]|nr:serine/threonine-protein kinase [Enhygromyxa sp.]
MAGLQAGDPQRVDRYSVLRRLGRGGMSTVYEAYDPELDRRIALKIVTAWDHGDDHGPARLVREARAMAKISHPNVAPVYDAGVFGDAVFIAMELIDGPTLEAWTTRTARPWTEIMRMYMLAGRGLAAAHDAGLVHRDFKPDNVMVGLDDRPRVLDFGLARPAALDDDDLLLDDDEEDAGVLVSNYEAEYDAVVARSHEGSGS